MMQFIKEDLENYLSEQCGEKVVCDEPNPVMINTVDLAGKYGVLGYAQVYKGSDGVTRACLFPYGAENLTKEQQ